MHAMSEETEDQKTEKPPAEVDGSAEYFGVYQHYSNLLRSWLLAYGIGAPVLFLTNEALWQKVVTSRAGSSIAWPFIVGVSLQVLLAAANKAVAWVLYFGELRPDFTSMRRYRCAAWVGEQFWVDLLIDVGSMVFLALGTWRLFALLG
jgi:hypothetical protein